MVRILADACGNLLHRILHRQCAGFCAARGTVEVILDRLGLALQTHLGVVPHPLGDDVNRKRFEQFDFPG
jgi:hypothetical protein